MTRQGIAAVALLLAAGLAGCSEGAQAPLGDPSPSGPALTSSDPSSESSSSAVANSSSPASGPGSSSQSTTTGSSSSETQSNTSSSSSSASSSTTSESASSSTSPTSGSTTSEPSLHQFQLTLVNDGSGVPDQFLCYVDGDSHCDDDQPLPASGQGKVYFFAAPEPDLLQVTVYYELTTWSRNYSFTSVGPSPTLEVHVSEYAISASCTSGCTLS